MKTIVSQEIYYRAPRAEAQKRSGRRVIIITLLVIIFLIGCDNNPNHDDTGFIPVGEWTGPDDWGDPDQYIITNTKITYVDPWDFNNFTGSIITATDFSSDAGVIIIQILNDPAPDSFTPNKFTCVFYKDYTSSNIKMAPPLDVNWNYIEVDTLNEAINTFTIDKALDVEAWGSYTK